MRIGFLTARAWRHLIADDLLAKEALELRGVRVEPVVWNENPSLDGLDALVVRTPWDYYRRQKLFQLFWSNLKVPMLLNDREVIEWNLNKSYLLDLEARRIPVVPSRRLGSAKELERLPWADLVMKPFVSAGAYHTYRLRREEWEGHLPGAEAILERGDILAQPYCPSISTLGEYSLVFFRDPKSITYSHAILKRPAPGDFRCQEKHGGTLAPVEPPKEWREVAEQALGAIPGNWLFARLDLVEWEGRPVVGEIEVFEPELFFRTHAGAPALFADKVMGWLG